MFSGDATRRPSISPQGQNCLLWHCRSPPAVLDEAASPTSPAFEFGGDWAQSTLLGSAWRIHSYRRPDRGSGCCRRLARPGDICRKRDRHPLPRPRAKPRPPSTAAPSEQPLAPPPAAAAAPKPQASAPVPPPPAAPVAPARGSVTVGSRIRRAPRSSSDGSNRGVTPLTISGSSAPARTRSCFRASRDPSGAPCRLWRAPPSTSARVDLRRMASRLDAARSRDLGRFEGLPARSQERDSSQSRHARHPVREPGAGDAREVRQVEIKPGWTTAITPGAAIDVERHVHAAVRKVFVDGASAGQTPVSNFAVAVGTRDIKVRGADGAGADVLDSGHDRPRATRRRFLKTITEPSSHAAVAAALTAFAALRIGVLRKRASTKWLPGGTSTSR